MSTLSLLDPSLNSTYAFRIYNNNTSFKSSSAFCCQFSSKCHCYCFAAKYFYLFYFAETQLRKLLENYLAEAKTETSHICSVALLETCSQRLACMQSASIAFVAATYDRLKVVINFSLVCYHFFFWQQLLWGLLLTPTKLEKQTL